MQQAVTFYDSLRAMQPTLPPREEVISCSVQCEQNGRRTVTTTVLYGGASNAQPGGVRDA